MTKLLIVLAAELVSLDCLANAVILSENFRGSRSSSGGSVSSSQGIRREVHPHFDGVEHRFASFMQEHGRAYKVGTDEYHRRLAIFSNSVAKIDSHNDDPHKAWQAGVNEFADWTDEESEQLRGLKKGGPRKEGNSVSFIASGAVVTHRHKLPRNVSWRHLEAFQGPVTNQGACGSCWAVASANVLRAWSELYSPTDRGLSESSGARRNFSIQQLVSCTPNPNECGGGGGCEGATAELAMEYAMNAHYMSSEAEFPYADDPRDPQCHHHMRMKSSSEGSRETSLVQGTSFGMLGYRTLDQNKIRPVMEALYLEGPLAVSVWANEHWNMYIRGVMNACDNKDVIINHAVTLIGYGDGEDVHGRPAMYWLILNSWGQHWGMNGTIQLLRLEDKEEEAYCGPDSRPLDGIGCKRGSHKSDSVVYPCGRCGILYDTVAPNFIKHHSSLISRLRS